MTIRMLGITTLSFTGAVVLAVGIAQAQGPAGRAAHATAAFGLTTEGNQDASRTRKNHDDGRVVIEEKARVDIAGKGSRTLTGTIDDQPISKGGVQKATIVDATAKQTVSFAFTPATNTIAITNGASKASIVQHADNSYSVDGKPAATGKAALTLLATNPAWATASPHAVMLAYSYAQQPNAAAKSDPSDEVRNPNATSPAVCTLFRDFCECAACDKAGKGTACQSCK